MPSLARDVLTPDELNRLLASIDPGTILVGSGVLRRLIKQDRRLPGLGMQVPHRKSYVIGRARLLTLVSRAELEVEPDRELPDSLILLARPEPEKLARLTREGALIKYWRLLFHARVHRELEARLAAGTLTDNQIHERIAHLNASASAEIRQVLEDERLILPPADERAFYTEFTAVFLDLLYFAPSLIAYYFPALEDLDEVHELIASDLDVTRILAGSRPPGAPEPSTFRDVGSDRLEEPAAPKPESPEPDPSSVTWRRWLRTAERAADRGNQLRAALWREMAVSRAPSEQRPAISSMARMELDLLSRRLQPALQLTDAEALSWRHCLGILLPAAARGLWPKEARLLYDLQRVCIDHEREVYSVDLVEWILSLFRRPLKRHLPFQRFVLQLKHLRSALHRLTTANLPEADRRQFMQLIESALHRAEERLRLRLRPVIEEALADVELTPRNYAEANSQRKLVEELLDLICERGFFSIGELRDAISRNYVKLPDLRHADEFIKGDRLIRANRRFAIALDGIYRRGEIYLRWLQRLSSLSFGTKAGRFVMLYFVLPFGVASVALEGLGHMINPVLGVLDREEIDLVQWPSTIPRSPEDALRILESNAGPLLLGFYLLGLIHVRAVRQGTIHVFRACALVLKKTMLDCPRWLVRLPIMRKILDSRIATLVREFVAKPMALVAPTLIVYPLYGVGWRTGLRITGTLFLALSLFLNSRPGRQVFEAITDACVRLWQRIRVDLIPGLFRLFVDFFKEVIEAVERVIYSVDEWLRFRTGQRWYTLLVKSLLGTIWFFFTYVVRIYINLLIEPTVNPIKHFPVVTVAAKLFIPFIPETSLYMTRALTPFVGLYLANSISWMNIVLIPGVFGFIAWELKENWRLYEANRAGTLRPVLIGSHGETMLRLLRPGIHSGTLPKLFARLRRAGRRAYATGDWHELDRQRESLHHVEECLRRFVQREFISLLEHGRAWRGSKLSIGDIRLGTNAVAIECRLGLTASLSIQFELHAGQLLARLTGTETLGGLSAQQRDACAAALEGLFNLAGVRQVQDHIDVDQDAPCFADTPLAWHQWVEMCECIERGDGHSAAFKPRVLQRT